MAGRTLDAYGAVMLLSDLPHKVQPKPSPWNPDRTGPWQPKERFKYPVPFGNWNSVALVMHPQLEKTQCAGDPRSGLQRREGRRLRGCTSAH